MVFQIPFRVQRYGASCPMGSPKYIQGWPNLDKGCSSEVLQIRFSLLCMRLIETYMRFRVQGSLNPDGTLEQCLSNSLTFSKGRCSNIEGALDHKVYQTLNEGSELWNLIPIVP